MLSLNLNYTKVQNYIVTKSHEKMAIILREQMRIQDKIPDGPPRKLNILVAICRLVNERM